MLSRRAQSIAEYMLFFTVLAFAITGVNTYVKRGIQGTVKSFSDMVGQQEDAETKTAVRERVNNTTTTLDTTSSDNPWREVFSGGGERTGLNMTQHSNGTTIGHVEADK